MKSFRPIILLLAIMTCSISFSQREKKNRIDEEFPTPVAFPYEYTGDFFGNLKVSNSEKTLSNIPTKFSLFKSEEHEGEFVYQITYMNGQKDNTQTYRLIILDEEKGYYVIKDAQGLEFMGVLVDDTLYSTFEIDDKITYTSLRFTNVGHVHLKIVLSAKMKKKGKSNGVVNSNVVLVQKAKFTSKSY